MTKDGSQHQGSFVSHIKPELPSRYIYSPATLTPTALPAISNSKSPFSMSDHNPLRRRANADTPAPTATPASSKKENINPSGRKVQKTTVAERAKPGSSKTASYDQEKKMPEANGGRLMKRLPKCHLPKCRLIPKCRPGGRMLIPSSAPLVTGVEWMARE